MMTIISRIIEKLQTALDYYEQTYDSADFVADIRELLNDLIAQNI